MVAISAPPVEDLEQCLRDEANAPIGQRMRALFYLKQIGGKRAVEAVAVGLESVSVLLKHEAAYVLGQMNELHAVPFLLRTLENEDEHPVARHEAAEALAALGAQEAIPVLNRFVQDSRPEVAETCELALARLEWLRENGEKEGNRPKDAGELASVDPAPPEDEVKSTQALVEQLLNVSLPLFKRYRAMFALRDLGTEEAVFGLARGFKDSSAVFRHEIAFVFGQMMHPAAAPSLREVLENTEEHSMVRHEAAEALGTLPGEDIVSILKEYALDRETIVSQSCEVALDIHEYWQADQPVSDS